MSKYIIFEENDCESGISDATLFEEKRESLLVLATLGLTKEYLGEELGVEFFLNLSRKTVEKYFNRYQLVQGKKVSNVLMEKGIRLGVQIISYFLPVDSSEKLIKDLENDELVNRELSNAIGFLVLKGGIFVAFASGLIQVANHIVIEPAKMLVTVPSTTTNCYKVVDKTVDKT